MNWAGWDGERDPDSPPQGTFIPGQGTPFVMQELETGRTNVLQTSQPAETSGSPRGAASSSCPADVFIFFAAQQVRQQKCHGLRRETEGEAMIRKVNSQIRGRQASRQAGNQLLHTFSPVPDSPNRSHDRHLGTTCLSLFLIKQTNHGWIPSAEAPIRRLSDLPPFINRQMGSLFRGRVTR